MDTFKLVVVDEAKMLFGGSCFILIRNPIDRVIFAAQ